MWRTTWDDSPPTCRPVWSPGFWEAALTIGGDAAGLQSLAAKLAGGVLVFVGLLRLFALIPFFQRKRSLSDEPSRVAGWLHQAKPWMADFGPAAKAYFGGVLTTWLPCGWLYLFVLMAAGTGSTATALVVMAAFWVGTLPALTSVLLGAHLVVPRFRSLVPVVAGVLLIVAGLYTATGRASANLSSMTAPKQLNSETELTSLVDLAGKPLPCCDTAADPAP